MEVDIVTKSELEKFKTELLAEIKELLDGYLNTEKPREWLSEPEARAFLKVSKSTLQKYRQNGVIPFSQYGRKIMFKQKDLDIFLNRNSSA